MNSRERKAYIRQNGGYLKVLTSFDRETTNDFLAAIIIFAIALGVLFL